MNWKYSSVVKHLPSACIVLGLNPSTTNNLFKLVADTCNPTGKESNEEISRLLWASKWPSIKTKHHPCNKLFPRDYFLKLKGKRYSLYFTKDQMW